MERRIELLEKAVGELVEEVRKLRAQLLETPQTELNAPEYGWKGLDLSATEILAESRRGLSSREISQRINRRREDLGFTDKTSPASVARALSSLVSRGIVTRIRAGREVHYSLNPARVAAITGSGEDPESTIDSVFKEIGKIPDLERGRTKAVWYSLHGPEEASRALRRKADVSDTKALCELYGMPSPPGNSISIGGVQDNSRRPIETRFYVFHLR